MNTLFLNQKAWKRSFAIVEVSLATFFLLLVSCASFSGTKTKRSSVEQLLLVRSLERACAEIELRPFTGGKVNIEVYGLTEDQAFAKAYITTKLQENNGISIATDSANADFRLKVFISALAVDRSERLFGIPAVQAPIIGIPFPEIAFYKSVHNRGRTELQLYAIDAKTDEVVGKKEWSIGEAEYNDYQILFLIDFNSNDLDKHPDDLTQ